MVARQNADSDDLDLQACRTSKAAQKNEGSCQNGLEAKRRRHDHSPLPSGPPIAEVEERNSPVPRPRP